MSRRVLVIHGANLALLGKREPEIYGSVTLAEIRDELESRATRWGHRLDWVTSNHEGVILDALGDAVGKVDGILINPGAFTHTSVGLRDALLAVSVPTIEVHLSNVHKREEFRRRSLISDVCVGVVTGLGASGMLLAYDALANVLEGIAFPPAAPRRKDGDE